MKLATPPAKSARRGAMKKHHKTIRPPKKRTLKGGLTDADMALVGEGR
jgi:hypothetical protein